MHSDNKVGGPVRETALYFSRGVSTAEKSCTKTKTIYGENSSYTDGPAPTPGFSIQFGRS